MDTYRSGAVLFYPDGRLTGYGARNDGSVTASQHAACEAILLGMFMAHMRQVDSILIMSNEQSVIKQMRGEIPVHSERIIKGYKMASHLLPLSFTGRSALLECRRRLCRPCFRTLNSRSSPDRRCGSSSGEDCVMFSESKASTAMGAETTSASRCNGQSPQRRMRSEVAVTSCDTTPLSAIAHQFHVNPVHLIDLRRMEMTSPTRSNVMHQEAVTSSKTARERAHACFPTLKRFRWQRREGSKRPRHRTILGRVTDSLKRIFPSLLPSC